MKRYLWMLAVIAAGCGGDAGEPTVGEDVADQYNEALDKAREAEEKIEASKERIDAALDEATGDDD